MLRISLVSLCTCVSLLNCYTQYTVVCPKLQPKSSQHAIKKAHATLAACAHSKCCYTCLLIFSCFLFAPSAFRTRFICYVLAAHTWWACRDLTTPSQEFFNGLYPRFHNGLLCCFTFSHTIPSLLWPTHRAALLRTVSVYGARGQTRTGTASIADGF